MDAPERIWMAPTKGNCHVGFNTPSMNYTNEYVRADLVAPMTVQAAAQVLLDNLPGEHQAWAYLQDAVDNGKDEDDCLRALAKPAEGDKPCP